MERMGYFVMICISIINRFRDKDLVLVLLKAMDQAAFCPEYRDIMVSQKMIARLLDFCKKPVSKEVTLLSLYNLRRVSESKLLL
jgi:hypothetical protein